MEIRFRVRDNGIGMSPEFLPHLYDPFSQERSEENITENLMDARILLVEDNEINIYVAQLILEKAGCVVEIANGTYHCHDSGCFLRGEEKDAGGRNELSPVQAHQPEDIV